MSNLRRYLVQPYLIGYLVTQNREINGERTVTSRPSSTQKFSRYKQAGGGAFIPVTLLVEGPQRYKEFVLEKCALLFQNARMSRRCMLNV